MIILIVGLCCGMAGGSFFILWVRDYLENGQRSTKKLDDNCLLSMTFIRAAEVFIVVWLIMNATGFRIGYLIALGLLIAGVYHSYLADMAEAEAEFGDLVIKKIILITLGFIALIVTGL